MTKYAILHGNYNIYHAEFETYEGAKKYYDEAPEQEDEESSVHLHYGVNYSKHDYPE